MYRTFMRNYNTIITVRDIVNRETPPKNDAAPTKANAPGSIQDQYPAIIIKQLVMNTIFKSSE